jgi:tetratricopeptide (TPR) repeat protein
MTLRARPLEWRGARAGLAAPVIALLVWASACGHAAGQSSPATPSPLRQKLGSYIAQGSQALQQQDNVAAERAFRHALALAPTSVEILNDLAISLAREGREDEAIAFYERALRLKPGDPITRRNLGVAYFRAHRYRQALPLLQSFADATPTFQLLDLTGIDLFALDRYAESAAYLERASRLQPDDIPTLDILGKAYWRAKDYSGVTQVFDRIMAIDPGSAEAHFMMGLAYDLASKEDAAYREFQAALAADPRYPGVHSSLGLIDWRLHKVPQAKAEFQQELAQYPNDPTSNYMMGRILRRQNQSAQAIPYLKAAVRANPHYADALLELGQCYIAQGQAQKALAPLQQATRADPGSAQAHFVLGTVWSMLGNTASAARERKICGQLQARQHARPIQDLSPVH